MLAIPLPTEAPVIAAPHHLVLHLPAVGALVRRAAPVLLEGVLVPTGLFYLGFWLGGVWGGMTAALVWSYAALGRRLLVGGVSGLLVMAVATLTVRAAVTGLSGNSDLYFIQPMAGEALMGLVFLASLPAGRSLAHRLAHDFVPLDGLGNRVCMRRVFGRITTLWAVVFIVHASLGLWLLANHSAAAYVGYTTAAAAVFKGLAVLASVVMFRSGLRRRGVRVAFGGAQPA